MTEPRLMGGRYELGELLGYGGMAEVHRGKDIRLGRDIAVKVLRADLARDPSFQNRFRREAQAAAGLNHPAIVAVYDTGEDRTINGAEGDITPYIVMEFVEGRTLREVLKSEGQLPNQRAMEITAEVCSALDFSHRSGIVHRDIKPGNVMITNAGAVKVMDFGIARALADGAATVTATSAVIGTAQYLSPEQARGESVDARSDVYSTGCLLYELVTGHPPFTGDSPVAVAYQHVRENPRIPSSVNAAVPKSLDSIVMKALAKNPLNRYQTAGEMRADLQRAITGQAVQAESIMTDAERTQFIAATPTSATKQGVLTPVYDEDGDTKRSKGAVMWIAVIVALLLVIGIAGWAILKTTQKKAAPQLYTVESLVGLSPAAAEDKIRALKLTVVVPHLPSNGPCRSGDDNSPVVTVAKGQVCTQDPPANTQLKQDEPVKFTVYAGPANIPVPSLVGLTFAEANDRLNAIGLKAKRNDVDSAQPAGTVVNQNPLAFNGVPPGSTVTLDVSNGHSKIPEVLHLTFAAAKAKLITAGFLNVAAPQEAEVADGFKVGDVQGADPPTGTSVDRTQKITLTVAIAKKLPKCQTSSPPPPTSPGSSGSPSATPSATPPSPNPTASPTCTP
jgi:beta-lactam-binding protein with PASTA domain/predicted Ser/Thr protein kinase